MKLLQIGMCTLVSIFALVHCSDAKTKKLEAYAQIQSNQINESSGLVKSRSHPDTYWTHNDSGGSARLFAIRRDGKEIRPEWDLGNKYKGLRVGDAVNIDWEELAIDSNGNLYIGAFGNNSNTRRDLAVYKIHEPDPREQTTTRSLQTIPIAYPDQTNFPPKDRNFDCEAFFFAGESLYFLTKHRSDTRTKLYRLDSQHSDQVNTLTYIDDFPIGGMVTAADASPDGSKLAVLTYRSVWVFQKPENSDNYLAGTTRRLKIKAGQCEAICWDDDNTLLISNEGQDLFQLKESELLPYEPDE